MNVVIAYPTFERAFLSIRRKDAEISKQKAPLTKQKRLCQNEETRAIVILSGARSAKSKDLIS